jgi:hypothetical protein
MSDERNIIFRRVRGRIIPIKTKKTIKETAKGLAYIGAGIGVAAVGAGLGGRMFKKAVKIGGHVRENLKTVSFASTPGNTTKFGKRLSEILLKSSTRHTNKMKSTMKISKYALHAGRFGGSFLVGIGAYDLTRQHAKRFGINDRGEQAFSSYLAGFTAGELANRAFLAGYDKKLAAKIMRARIFR